MIFADSNHLEELAQYMDINVLPSCINPNGRGETAMGMPKRMEGGTVPSYVGKGGRGYVPVSPTFNDLSPRKADSVTSSEDESDSPLRRDFAAITINASC